MKTLHPSLAAQIDSVLQPVSRAATPPADGAANHENSFSAHLSAANVHAQTSRDTPAPARRDRSGTAHAAPPTRARKPVAADQAAAPGTPLPRAGTLPPSGVVQPGAQQVQYLGHPPKPSALSADAQPTPALPPPVAPSGLAPGTVVPLNPASGTLPVALAPLNPASGAAPVATAAQTAASAAAVPTGTPDDGDGDAPAGLATEPRSLPNGAGARSAASPAPASDPAAAVTSRAVADPKPGTGLQPELAAPDRSFPGAPATGDSKDAGVAGLVQPPAPRPAAPTLPAATAQSPLFALNVPPSAPNGRPPGVEADDSSATAADDGAFPGANAVQSRVSAAGAAPLDAAPLRALSVNSKTLEGVDDRQDPPAEQVKVAGTDLTMAGLGFAPSASLHGASGGARATPSAPPVTVPLDSPDFGPRLAESVNWAVNQNLTHAQISLNPEHLGPLEIRLSLAGNQASVWFGTHSAAAAEALASTTAHLRSMLGQAGYSAVNVDISRHSGQQAPQQGFAYRASAAATRLVEPEATVESTPERARLVTRSAIDAYV